jgi:hypothetical protein
VRLTRGQGTHNSTECANNKFDFEYVVYLQVFLVGGVAAGVATIVEPIYGRSKSALFGLEVPRA